MPLTDGQYDMMVKINHKAKKAIAHGGEEALLMLLVNHMPNIKAIMDAATKAELTSYCQNMRVFTDQWHC
jgi:hypothetical protein